MALLLHGKGIAVAAQAVAGAGGNIVRVELFSVDVNAKGDLAAYGDLAVDILLQPDGLAVLHVVHGILKCLIVGTVNLSRWADLRLQSEGAEPVTGGKGRYCFHYSPSLSPCRDKCVRCPWRAPHRGCLS